MFLQYLSIALAINSALIVVLLVCLFHLKSIFFVVLLLFSTIFLNHPEISEAQSDVGSLQVHKHLHVLVFTPFIHELLHVLDQEH